MNTFKLACSRALVGCLALSLVALVGLSGCKKDTTVEQTTVTTEMTTDADGNTTETSSMTATAGTPVETMPGVTVSDADMAEYDKQKDSFLSSCSTACVAGNGKEAVIKTYCDKTCACAHDSLKKTVPLKDYLSFNAQKSNEEVTKRISNVMTECMTKAQQTTGANPAQGTTMPAKAP